MEKLLNIRKAEHNPSSVQSRVKIESISKKDIAIIGIAGTFGQAENVDEFWKGLVEGRDFICQLSQRRKEECDAYIKTLRELGLDNGDFEFYDAGYMDRIDCFDGSMFNISPKEAVLMDPHQRLLLETIWTAIEDAGYGGKKISGSRTGVYVGHSSDFGEEYKRYSRMLTSTSEEASVTGNIRSIIASRISYILDLKGPSMVIDTACSSTLVAIHTACKAIRNEECDMAIAGGANVYIVPVIDKGGQGNLGIVSPSARAKTFDEDSDGTGSGEGVGAIILKSLSKAMEDGDNIYAVIKGSAVNQDGASVGITAPNMAAQVDAILRAWKDAEIDPETISYIETHGTGTKLGDPIEITAIQKAFSHYTDRKQFCAVASVKTNIGHLDNAAGITSLIKAVMSLKHSQLPASLNFKRPNAKILFESSPVYVNDRLKKWESSEGPKRCGISSFGLSGTNCHLVLEEYIQPIPDTGVSGQNTTGEYVMTISAKNRESFERLIDQYESFFSKTTDKEIENICYTADTGRDHYPVRAAFTVSSLDDLKKKIRALKENSETGEKGIFYGEHKIIPESKSIKAKNEITESSKKSITNTAAELIESTEGHVSTELLEQLCSLYIKGADMKWEKLFSNKKIRKISIPTYPFLKESYWVKPDNRISQKHANTGTTIGHPVLDCLVAETMTADIYSTNFSVEKHWVLNEHRVAGNYVVPGTTYIEIAHAIASRYIFNAPVELNDVIFVTPLVVEAGSPVEAQTIVKTEEGYWEFVVTSRSNGGSWIRHAEGKFTACSEEMPKNYDLPDLKGKFSRVEEAEYFQNITSGVETGLRFRNVARTYIGTEEMLAYLVLREEYAGDLDEFYIHPALLDCAVNIAKGALKDSFYLPISYKKMKIFGKMPGKIYSHIIKKSREKDSNETGIFDIQIMDEQGTVFAVIEDYMVKKVHKQEWSKVEIGQKVDFYKLDWIKKAIDEPSVELDKGSVLVFKDSAGESSKMVQKLKMLYEKVYEVEIGTRYERLDDFRFILSSEEEDYRKLLASIDDDICYILHFTTLAQNSYKNDRLELEGFLDNGVYSLFYLVRSLIEQKIGNIKLILVTNFASEVVKKQALINPHNAAFLGLGRVISMEYPQIKCRGIDFDGSISVESIINEMKDSSNLFLAAYRDGARYVEEFETLDKNALNQNDFQIKEDGVYIVTGGAGGIGLEISKYFTSKDKVNLCLINRSLLPERSLWEDILRKNEDKKLCTKIKAIMEIESTGSSVRCYSADISDSAKVSEILEECRMRFGRINGVIHAAGIAGDGFIIRKNPERFKEVLRPKIHGIQVLDRLTQKDKLDFFIACSSMTSIFGGQGQGDYTAANSYMDAYVNSMSRQGKTASVINWPAWKEVGMAVDYNAVNDDFIIKPIGTRQAMFAFEKLLGKSLSRVIPSTINYRAFELAEAELPMALSDQIRQALERQKPVKQKALNISDVELKGKLDQSYTANEKEIASMWGSVLGVSELDIFDNFNDLGGDSILATKLLKEMQNKYGSLVDISDIFTYPSVKEMADFIDRKTNGRKEFEKIEEDNANDDLNLDELLKRLSSGELSEEEAEKLLSLEE